MDWSGTPCLVTGGAGFGGAHLVEQLLALGARVVVADRYRRRHSYWEYTALDDQTIFHEGDVRDSELLKFVLAQHDVQTVFHLAAQPLVPLSNLLPLETFSINTFGTWVLLEAVRAVNPRVGVVFASSGAYYGSTNVEAPIPETAGPIKITNMYAASKIAADASVLAYTSVYGLNTVVCRFMNTYGPGDLNFSRIIPRAARNLLTDRPYEFGDREDGSNRLTYLHVRDMASAYITAAEHLDAVRGEAFNFGTTDLVATRDIVALVSHLFDGTTRTGCFTGPRRGTAKILDVTKAEHMLGWRPTIDLEAGLSEALAWYREHPDSLGSAA